MLRVVILTVIAAAAYAQYPQQQQQQQQPQIAAFPNTTPNPQNLYPPAPVHYVSIGGNLQGDYKFGYDTGKGPLGQSFREESRLPDGTIKGQYGILDASGRQRIIKYTAGRGGFQAEGDGIPLPPAPPAAPQGGPQGAPAFQSPAQPQFRPQPQYQQPQFQPQQYQAPAQPQYQQPAPQPQPAPVQFAPQSAQSAFGTATNPYYDHQKHYLQYQDPEYQRQNAGRQQPNPVFDSSLLDYNIGLQRARAQQRQ